MNDHGLRAADLRLGEMFHFYKRGYKGFGVADEAAGVIHELIKAGWTEQELEDEIKSDDRKRTETTWEFEKRMTAMLASRPKVSDTGEVDQADEDWRRFEVAYIAEWPRFGRDYSFLEDWKTQKPFDVATLEELIGAIRTVRANPKQGLNSNKFAMLAAAIWEVRRRAAVAKPLKEVERAMSVEEWEEFKKKYPRAFK